MKIKKFGSMSKRQIKTIEKKYSLRLPDDYKEFLKTIGGGQLELTEENVIEIRDLDDSITLDLLFGNSAQKEATIELWMDKYNDEIPADTIIIGDSIMHGFIVMICSGQDQGIYYWDDTYYFDASDDENNTYFIAETFKEFLKLLNLEITKN